MHKSLLTFVRAYWISLTLILFLLITCLSLLPLDNLPPAPGTDKFHHVVAYCILMLPVAIRKHRLWLLVGLFFICWSGMLEVIQPYVNRYGEWLDLFANAAGVICASLIGQLVNWISPE